MKKKSVLPFFTDRSSAFSSYGLIPELMDKLLSYLSLLDIAGLLALKEFEARNYVLERYITEKLILKLTADLTPAEILSGILKRPELGLNKFFVVCLDVETEMCIFAKFKIPLWELELIWMTESASYSGVKRQVKGKVPVVFTKQVYLSRYADLIGYKGSRTHTALKQFDESYSNANFLYGFNDNSVNRVKCHMLRYLMCCSNCNTKVALYDVSHVECTSLKISPNFHKHISFFNKDDTPNSTIQFTFAECYTEIAIVPVDRTIYPRGYYLQMIHFVLSGIHLQANVDFLVIEYNSPLSSFHGSVPVYTIEEITAEGMKETNLLNQQCYAVEFGLGVHPLFEERMRTFDPFAIYEIHWATNGVIQAKHRTHKYDKFKSRCL